MHVHYLTEEELLRGERLEVSYEYTRAEAHLLQAASRSAWPSTSFPKPLPGRRGRKTLVGAREEHEAFQKALLLLQAEALLASAPRD